MQVNKPQEQKRLSLPLRPLSRSLKYGIVVVNKPDGPTSHQVSEYVQRIVGVDKAGHSGTLDPGVTGVLPIALGDATKVTQITLKSDKEYVGLLFLHKDVPQQQLLDAMKKFTGRIMQMPPVRSAVKRVERPRMVYDFELLERKGQDVLVRVRCEAGTYIRKLFHDMGVHLGCGAHMAQLIRTKAAGFSFEESVTLQQLTDAVHEWKEGKPERLQKMMYPVERIVEKVPFIIVKDDVIRGLLHGKTLRRDGVDSWSSFAKGEMITLKNKKNELLTIANAVVDSGRLSGMSDGVVAKSDRVYYKEEWLGER